MLRLRLEKGTVEAMAGKFSRRLKFSTDKALERLSVELADWLRVEQQKGTAGGWPELKTSYAQEKERHYPGQLILTRTGTLMATYPRYVTINRNKREVALGFPRGKVGKIARVHQFGYEPRNIPARPFPVDSAGLEAFTEIAYRNFSDAVREALNG